MADGFLVGCLIAGAILVGLVLSACAVLCTWPAAEAAGERVCDFFLVATALAVGLVQLLGFAGGLRTGPILAAALGCGGLALLPEYGARARVRMLVADLQAGLEVLARSPPLLAVIALGLLLATRGLALPELSWDGLTYHLTYPALWLETGRFTRFEAGGVWEQYESFPKGAEALFFLAMLPFHADTFVHWVNVPLWLATGCAVRAAVLRLGRERRAADVCTLIVLGCPALSAYVTPAYVEVATTFALCAALAAALRVLAAREVAALAPAGLALCLAASFKVTALAYLPLILLVALGAMRAQPPRNCLRWTAHGLLLGAAVLVPWYAHNLVQCDNPLYPAGLPGAEEGPAAGSLDNAWAVRESSVLAQAAWNDILEFLARPPWRVRYPLGPGLVFLAALPASLFLCVCAAASRAHNPPADHDPGPSISGSRATQLMAAILLCLLAAALVCIYALSPWNGVFREANTRFLMPALIAAIISLAASTARLPAWIGRALSAVGCALVLAALSNARFIRDGIVDGHAALAVLTSGAAFASSLHAATVPAARRLRWTAVALCATSLALVALSQAARARAQRGADAYALSIDLHPVAISAKLWRYIDGLPASRIAFSVGDINATEGWFFYPLFGTRLQHSVRYVDIEVNDEPVCRRRGLSRDHPDEHAWRERLRATQVDYLVIAGQPIEHAWARSAPSLFQPVFQAGNAVVYRCALRGGAPP